MLFKCFHNHCNQTINPSPSNNFLQIYQYWDVNPIVHNTCMNEDLAPIINGDYFITNKNYIRIRSDNNYNLTSHLLMHEFDNFLANIIKPNMRSLFNILLLMCFAFYYGHKWNLVLYTSWELATIVEQISNHVWGTCDKNNI